MGLLTRGDDAAEAADDRSQLLRMVAMILLKMVLLKNWPGRCLQWRLWFRCNGDGHGNGDMYGHGIGYCCMAVPCHALRQSLPFPL